MFFMTAHPPFSVQEWGLESTPYYIHMPLVNQPKEFVSTDKYEAWIPRRDSKKKIVAIGLDGLADPGNISKFEEMFLTFQSECLLKLMET